MDHAIRWPDVQISSCLFMAAQALDRGRVVQRAVTASNQYLMPAPRDMGDGSTRYTTADSTAKLPRQHKHCNRQAIITNQKAKVVDSVRGHVRPSALICRICAHGQMYLYQGEPC